MSSLGSSGRCQGRGKGADLCVRWALKSWPGPNKPHCRGGLNKFAARGCQVSLCVCHECLCRADLV